MYQELPQRASKNPYGLNIDRSEVSTKGLTPEEYSGIHSEITSAWKNAPEYTVHSDWAGIPDNDPVKADIARADGKLNTLGWVDQEGKMNVIAGNITSPEMAAAVTFHESLGHTGMSNLFGKRYGEVLRDIHDTNPVFREAVQTELREAPGEYEMLSPMERIEKAGDEVFANMSEDGPVSAGIFRKLSATVKDIGRRIGIKAEYSDPEIRAILSMAHNTVINGTRSPFSGFQPGARFMKLWHTSPHKFDEIDHSHMGKGEGFQAYGWGTYLAESELVSGRGGHYYEKFAREMGRGDTPRNRISDNSVWHLAGNSGRDYPISTLVEMIYRQNRVRHNYAVNRAKELGDTFEGYRHEFGDNWKDHVRKHLEADTSYRQSSISVLDDLEREGKFAGVYDGRPAHKAGIEINDFILKNLDQLTGPPPGRKPSVYRVDVPDDSRFLELDKKLSEQSPEVRKILAEKFGIGAIPEERAAKIREVNAKRSEELLEVEKEFNRLMDARFAEADKYRNLINTDKEAARKAVEEIIAKYKDPISSAQKQMTLLQNVIMRGNRLLDAGLDKTGREFYEETSRRLGSDKAASLSLDDAGIHGNKYYDGFSRYGKGQTHNYVIFNDKRMRIDSRFMRKKTPSSGSPTPQPEQPVKRIDSGGNVTPKKGYVNQITGSQPIEPTLPEYTGGINFDRVSTDAELNDFLRAQAATLPPEAPQSNEVTKELANRIGMTPREVLAISGLTPQEIHAANTVLVEQTQRVMKLHEMTRADPEDDLSAMALLRAYAQQKAVLAKVMGERSKLGRSLQALRVTSELLDDLTRSGRFSIDTESIKGDFTPEAGRELAKQMSVAMSAAAEADAGKIVDQIAKDFGEPHWLDKVTSFRYSMMLYGMGTHAKNSVGNTLFAVSDLLDHVPAAAYDSVFRRGAQDRVHIGEIKERLQGMLQASTLAQAVREARESFKLGHPLHAVEKFEETSHQVFSNSTKAGALINAPFRALAFEDQFFRTITENGYFRGLAYRQAKGEGLSGAELAARVEEIVQDVNNVQDRYRSLYEGISKNPRLSNEQRRSLIKKIQEDQQNDPAQKILNEANRRASIIQLVSEPDKLTQSLGTLTASKDPLIRFVFKNLFPFKRVASNAFWRSVGRSPLAPLDKEWRADFLAGGARRSEAIGRLAVGTAFYSLLYFSGVVQNSPHDYKYAMQENALTGAQSGWSAPSVKYGDNTYSLASIDGLGIMAKFINTWETATDRGQISPEDYIGKLSKAAEAFAWTYFQSSPVEDAGNAVALFDTKTAGDTARGRFAGQVVASFLPNFLRTIRSAIDPAARVATGDGSFLDRVKGTVQNKIPGLSQSLPQATTTLGEDIVNGRGGLISGLTRSQPAAMTPVKEELARLTSASKVLLVGPVDKADLRKVITDRPVTANDVQQYQRESGRLITARLSEIIGTPEYQELSDEVKVGIVKDVVSDARKEIRETMRSGDAARNPN